MASVTLAYILFVSLLELIEQKRNEIISIAAAHGASNVRVFGSVRRGTQQDRSDIDFLVVLEPGRSLLDHAALKLDLENLLGRSVDIATERGLKPRYRDRILKESIAI